MLLQMVGFPFFLRLNSIPLYVGTTFSLSIYVSIDEYLGCFHILGIVNNATMNTEGTVISLNPSFDSLGYLPRMLDHMAVLVLVFE